MMNDSYQDKLLRTSRTFFGRWEGADGEMRELTVSHRSLLILLRRGLSGGNLLVACLGPQRITGPVHWKDCRLELRVHDSLVDGHPGFCLVDVAAGLEIVCGAVEIAENVKLHVLDDSCGGDNR